MSKVDLQEEIERLAEAWLVENIRCSFNKGPARASFKAGAQAALELMQAREAKLVEALRFYADQERWMFGIRSDGYKYLANSEGTSEVEMDTGKLARQTLAELGLAEEGDNGNRE